MGLWRKKPAVEQRPPQTREKITLLAIDTPHERARKIWALLGFANDRHGKAAQIAEYLAYYQSVDRQYRRQDELT